MCEILLIEDNDGDILLLKEAFDEINSKALLSVIKDGHKASEYFDNVSKGLENQKIPDIILLDINLPKVNGHEILQKIRRCKPFYSTPVIMLTTSSSNRDIQKAYENKVNCYITKPSDLDNFFSIIRSINNFWLNVATLPS